MKKLIETYRKYPEIFIKSVLKLEPTEQQMQLIQAIKDGHKFISIKSGHGTGKSTIVACLVLWFLCCYRSQVPITAPSSAQLFDALWSRLGERYGAMTPQFKQNLEMIKDRVYAKDAKTSHFCVARTAKKEKPEALQGFHAKHLLFLVDEASAVDENIYDTIMGSLTEEHNIIILIGNPTRISGTFYDSFNKSSEDWFNLTFNSEDAPRSLVTQRYLNQMARHGKDSNRYRIRVLGEFPKTEEDTLISYSDVEEATTRTLVDVSGAHVWGLDVARYGGDHSVLLKRQGLKVSGYRKWAKKDTMETAGIVMAEYRQTPDSEKPEFIFVDVIGVGAGVYDRLNEKGLPVRPVNVSEKSNKPKEYKNIRAEAFDTVREWFQDYEPDIPDDEDLIKQITTIKYKFASNGAMLIEAKDVYRKRMGFSPDIADALMLTFYGRNVIELNIVFV